MLSVACHLPLSWVWDWGLTGASVGLRSPGLAAGPGWARERSWLRGRRACEGPVWGGDLPGAQVAADTSLLHVQSSAAGSSCFQGKLGFDVPFHRCLRGRKVGAGVLGLAGLLASEPGVREESWLLLSALGAGAL